LTIVCRAQGPADLSRRREFRRHSGGTPSAFIETNMTTGPSFAAKPATCGVFATTNAKNFSGRGFARDAACSAHASRYRLRNWTGARSKRSSPLLRPQETRIRADRADLRGGTCGNQRVPGQRDPPRLHDAREIERRTIRYSSVQQRFPQPQLGKPLYILDSLQAAGHPSTLYARTSDPRHPCQGVTIPLRK
jgi:hypothetical protein